MKMTAREHVISGVFESRDDAHHALDALAPTGVDTENISVITNMRDFEEEEFSEIAGMRWHDESIHAGKIGRAVGAIVAGMTALAGMMFGHVAALPAVLIIVASSAFGALLGTLIGAGFTENEWDELGHSIQNGKVLLAVHTQDFSTSRQVSQILKDCQAHAVHAH